MWEVTKRSIRRVQSPECDIDGCKEHSTTAIFWEEEEFAWACEEHADSVLTWVRQMVARKRVPVGGPNGKSDPTSP